MKKAEEILTSIDVPKDEIKHYLETSRPTLLLNISEQEDYDSKGNNRIGGWPDLPKGFQYPSNYNGELYIFIAQINLEKIAPKVDLNFPNSGMIYFFLISDEDDSQNIKHLVWYSDKRKEELIKYQPQKGYKFCTTIYEKEFPAYKIELIESDSINSNKFAENYSSKISFEGEIEKLIYLPSRIGGYSQSSDGDVEGNIIWEKGELNKYERVLISKGYPFNDRNYIEESEKWIQNQLQELKITKSIARRHQKESIIRDYREEQKAYKRLIEKKDKIKEELEKWKLLISIESIDKLNMCWWDSGSLEFYINEDDLKNMDFTNTHCIINNAG